jgi:hypothetical protein
LVSKSKRSGLGSGCRIPSAIETSHTAEHYYEDARSAAHDAQNIDLLAYILSDMSYLATWQGKPRVGLDHAIVAQSWAAQTNNPRVEGCAADAAARAFAADQREDACRKQLDVAQATLARIEDDADDPRWHYFFNEAAFWGRMSQCALWLGAPERALETVSKSLAIHDPADIHNLAFTMLSQAEAFTQIREIDEASRVLGKVVTLTATHTSARLHQRTTNLRTALAPWQHSKPVRDLDELIAAYSPPLRNTRTTERG